MIELASASARIVAAQILAAEETQTFSVPILVVAAGVALAWWAVLAVVVVARRPPRIRADGGGGLELPPEPPAVAAILAGDFEVASETAPAIVLDLAARGFVELDEVQPGKTICRIRRAGSADPGALNDYEQRVLGELTRKAVDGVVPVEALTTGPAEQSKRWHRALTREVVGDAQASGLTKRALAAPPHDSAGRAPRDRRRAACTCRPRWVATPTTRAPCSARSLRPSRSPGSSSV